MRKGCDGEKKSGKNGKNTSLAAKGALANRLQRRTACKIQNVRSCQLSLNKFFDPSTPSMRKGCDGEKKMRKKVKIAVHYRRASLSPEQTLTGMQTALANWGSTTFN